jgi:hypothetical protein
MLLPDAADLLRFKTPVRQIIAVISGLNIAHAVDAAT